MRNWADSLLAGLNRFNYMYSEFPRDRLPEVLRDVFADPRYTIKEVKVQLDDGRNFILRPVDKEWMK